jgi:hypothetical protein
MNNIEVNKKLKGGSEMTRQNNQGFNRNYNSYQQRRSYNFNQQHNSNQSNRNYNNYQQSQNQQHFGHSLTQVQDVPIEILNNTIFDIFGGIPQSFVGISGEAGAGKSQLLMKFIADVSLQEPVLVVLTEQSPQRWKALFRKYLDNNLANPNNIRIIAKQHFDEMFLNQLRQVPERIIVIDSVSGATNEQNARQVARKLRNLVEYQRKWIIGSLQMRNTGNIAGGEGVEHMIEVSFKINHFILKPQHIWYRRKLEQLGYEIGDSIRIIREEFNKIEGVRQRNIVLYEISPDNPIPKLREIEYNQEEYERFIREERERQRQLEQQTEQQT